MPRSSDAQGFRLRIQQLTQRIKLRAVFEMVVVGVCTVAFALNAAGIFTTLLTDDYAGQRDFVTYWSAGRQLLRVSEKCLHRWNGQTSWTVLERICVWSFAGRKSRWSRNSATVWA